MILTSVTTKKDKYDFESNLDKEFMIECAKIDENRPETWDKYKDNPMSIVSMEYAELLKTTTNEEKIEEIYHLSASLLNLWRSLKKV